MRTCAEIAKILGLSAVRVQQILKTALAKLRPYFDVEDLRGDS